MWLLLLIVWIRSGVLGEFILMIEVDVVRG
jgi:hypothetical protein